MPIFAKRAATARSFFVCLLVAGVAGLSATAPSSADAQSPMREPVGTAIGVSDGHAVIANHLLNKCFAGTITLSRPNSAQKVRAEIVWQNQKSNIAVLTFDRQRFGLSSLPFERDRYQGDTVAVFAYEPLGGRAAGTNWAGIFGHETIATLSGVNGGADEFQTSAGTVDGITGGLVLSNGGHVLGLVDSGSAGRANVIGSGAITSELDTVRVFYRLAGTYAVPLHPRRLSQDAHGASAIVSCDRDRRSVQVPAVAASALVYRQGAWVDGEGDLLRRKGFSRKECVNLFDANPRAQTMEYNADTKCNLWSTVMPIAGPSTSAEVMIKR